jgi:hypothetical protein
VWWVASHWRRLSQRPWAFFRLEGGEAEYPALILAIGAPIVTPFLLRPFLPRGWSPVGAGFGGLLGLAVWWGLAWAYLGPRYGPKPITFVAVFPLAALGAFAASWVTLRGGTVKVE